MDSVMLTELFFLFITRLNRDIPSSTQWGRRISDRTTGGHQNSLIFNQRGLHQDITLSLKQLNSQILLPCNGCCLIQGEFCLESDQTLKGLNNHVSWLLFIRGTDTTDEDSQTLGSFSQLIFVIDKVGQFFSVQPHTEMRLYRNIINIAGG